MLDPCPVGRSTGATVGATTASTCAEMTAATCTVAPSIRWCAARSRANAPLMVSEADERAHLGMTRGAMMVRLAPVAIEPQGDATGQPHRVIAMDAVPVVGSECWVPFPAVGGPWVETN